MTFHQPLHLPVALEIMKSCVQEGLGRWLKRGEDTLWQLQFAQVQAVVCSPSTVTGAPRFDVVLE